MEDGQGRADDTFPSAALLKPGLLAVSPWPASERGCGFTVRKNKLAAKKLIEKQIKTLLSSPGNAKNDS